MRKLLFFAALALALSGCAKEGEQSNYGDRFSIRTYGQKYNFALYVIIDNQTDQEYLLVKGGYGCSLAPMQTKK